MILHWQHIRHIDCIEFPKSWLEKWMVILSIVNTNNRHIVLLRFLSYKFWNVYQVKINYQKATAIVEMLLSLR